MNLYDINQNLEHLLEFIALTPQERIERANFDEELKGFIDEVGGLTETCNFVVDSLYNDKQAKIKAILEIINQAKLDAEQVRTEIQRLEKLKKRAENKQEWLKGYLETCLAGDTYKDSLHSVSYRKSKALEVTNEELIPREYLRVKTEVDKAQITKLIKAGETIPGAELVERTSMVIK